MLPGRLLERLALTSPYLAQYLLSAQQVLRKNITATVIRCSRIGGLGSFQPDLEVWGE